MTFQGEAAMSGAAPRQPPSPSLLTRPTTADSFSLAAGFLGLMLCFDVCLAGGFSQQRWLLGGELQCLACLVLQMAFVSLLARRAIRSPVAATLVFVGSFLLVNGVIAVYARSHPYHYGYASALLAGQLAFLGLWLILGDQPLGWRMLATGAAAGILVVGWYGYAARRSMADWNLIWMTETAGVTAAAVLLRIAGFKITRVGESEKCPDGLAGRSAAEGEAQYSLWHLMAGLFVASCLFGLARLLGVIKPTYFADLAAHETDWADVQRGLGLGFAAALAVAFAAHSVLLRAHLVARYLPPLIYAIAMGYAIHAWGPPYVDASIVNSNWSANLPGWSPTASQWPIWMLLNASMAMSGTMFLHSLGCRLTRR